MEVAAQPLPPQKPPPARTAKPVTPAQQSAPQPAPPQAQPGPKVSRTEILNFDNWSVTCNEFASGPVKKACSAQIRVMQSNTKQVLLLWNVALNDQRKPVALLQTPTGVLVQPGIEIKLGDKAARKLPYESCEPARCVAADLMDDAFVRDLAAAKSAEIVFYAANRNGIKINVPVAGFAQALAQLQKS